VPLALCTLVLLGAVACGGDSATGESTIEVATVGAQPEDQTMAMDVQTYFERNAAGAPWYGDIESISVVDGVITIDTALDFSESSGREAADQICALIQGSDVADFTPGHTVLGDEAVVCPARTN
jgi:hypothetical protein